MQHIEQKIDLLTELLSRFIQKQEGFNREVKDFIVTQEQVNKKQADINKEIKKFIVGQNSYNSMLDIKVNGIRNTIEISGRSLRESIRDSASDVREDIAKTQYFLEQTVAVSTDALFDEDSALRMRVVDLEERTELHGKNLYDMSVDVSHLQKA